MSTESPPSHYLISNLDPRFLHGFVAVFRCRNFRVAAEQLGIPLASLSRYIKALENQLGVKLFQRTTRQVVPTSLAEILYARVQKPLQDLSDALYETQQAKGSISGVVRLTTTSMMAEIILPSVLQQLAQNYPEIRLELILDEHITDIRARGIDIAIRAGRVKDESLIGHELAKHKFYEYCAPQWIGRADVPRLSYFDEDHPEDSLVLSSNLRLNYLAACAGAGRAVLPELLCAEDVAAGRLVKYQPDVMGNYSIYLLYTSREYLPERVRVILSLIKQHAGAVHD
jgi:DNA-binding transcriptional LysR family regulator